MTLVLRAVFSDDNHWVVEAGGEGCGGIGLHHSTCAGRLFVEQFSRSFVPVP